jgi:hypothetical protein
MTSHEHPEELIDRAKQGALDADHQAVLDRHLATCVTCAAHLSMAPRFERELAPQPRDQILDERAVEAAMLRMQGSPPVLRRHAAPSWLRWAAAAVVLVSGFAAAAAFIGRRITSHPPSQPPGLTADPPAPRPRPLTIEVAPPDVPVPAESPTPRTVSPERPSARPAVTAAALFERGGKLQREGHADAAIVVYRRLQAMFPETPEARLSFALAGQLHLKRGRPSEALAQFDRHLRLGSEASEVSEEALAGRATALEQLHRTADAVAAWKTLLERHPGTVYAERARARLDQIIERR